MFSILGSRFRGKRYQNNFQVSRPRFFPGFEISRHFFQPIKHGEKSGKFQNPENNQVLESCSNIFFPLEYFPSRQMIKISFCSFLNGFKVERSFTQRYNNHVLHKSFLTILKQLVNIWTQKCSLRLVFYVFMEWSMVFDLFYRDIVNKTSRILQ